MDGGKGGSNDDEEKEGFRDMGEKQKNGANEVRRF